MDPAREIRPPSARPNRSHDILDIRTQCLYFLIRVVEGLGTARNPFIIGRITSERAKQLHDLEMEMVLLRVLCGESLQIVDAA